MPVARSNVVVRTEVATSILTDFIYKLLGFFYAVKIQFLSMIEPCLKGITHSQVLLRVPVLAPAQGPQRQSLRKMSKIHQPLPTEHPVPKEVVKQ
jgi:hypothetical protein